jgi:predicted phosphohydrolase
MAIEQGANVVSAAKRRAMIAQGGAQRSPGYTVSIIPLALKGRANLVIFNPIHSARRTGFHISAKIRGIPLETFAPDDVHFTPQHIF